MDVGPSYGYAHMLRSLQYVCDYALGQYNWFVMVLDSMYINPVALQSILRHLSSQDPVILGRFTVLLP